MITLAIIFGACSVLLFVAVFFRDRGYKAGVRDGQDDADHWWMTVARTIDIESFTKDSRA